MRSKNDLTRVAKLQQTKIAKELERHIETIKPPTTLKQSTLLALAFILIGLATYFTNLKSYFTKSTILETPTEVINFQAINSLEHTIEPPKIIDQNLRISYPKYTRLGSQNSSNMNIRAVEGSRITWFLEFNANVKNVHIESLDNTYDMLLKDGKYSGTTKLQNSGFYNFKFVDTLGQIYTSDIYSIEVTADKSPEIKLTGLDQFSSFNFNDTKQLDVKTLLSG